MFDNIEKFPAENPAPAENTVPTETDEASAEASKAELKEVREATLQKMEDIVKQASTGTLKLSVPFKSDGIVITELHYNFKAVTGLEFADAMDSDFSRKSDSFRITGKQAIALFAVAVEKCEEHVDRQDVLRGLSAEDSVAAIQAATLFFRAASQAGNLRTIRV